MILTTHILTGALLGAEVKNPYAVAGLAVAAHFALDLLPHGDYLNKKSSFKEFWKVTVDLAIGLGAVVAILFYGGEIVSANIQNIAIGIFFSLLPDGTTLLYMTGMNFLRPLKNFHEKLHFYPNFSPRREFRLKNNLFDIIISLLSFLFLICL